MPIAINGTTGISGVDGSASAPALQGSDSNTGVSFGTDTVNLNTGGSTRYSIDSSGDIQAGGANPVFTGSSLSSFKIAAPDGGSRYFFGEIGNSVSSQLSLYNSSDQQKVRIAAGDGTGDGNTFFNGGNVGINTSSPSDRLQVIIGTKSFGISNTNARIQRGFSGGGSIDDDGMWFVDNDSTSGTYIRFWQTVGGAHQIGSISHGTSSTSYNTSSDYRLKENVVPISDGITRLKTLKPSRFNFKNETGKTLDGFLAHEVTAVPEAITGTKDEVSETDEPQLGYKKGDPIYQGIDQSKLVPLLTAALQEAVAKIEVLETKVSVLEAA